MSPSKRVRRLSSFGLLWALLFLSVYSMGQDTSAPLDIGAARFERLGPFGGTVRSLLISRFDRNVVYLGNRDGQIYRSQDGGVSWTMLYPGIGRRQLVVDSIAEHPEDEGHLFAGAWDLRSEGGGLFESRDGGIHWTPVELPEESPAVRDFKISLHSPSHMIVGTLKGAYVSDDHGKTWRVVKQKSGDFQSIESVAIDPDEPRFLYIGTWRLGYSSTDFGHTWVRINKGMILDSHVFTLSVDSENPKTIFAGACTGVYRSVDRGATWKRLKLLRETYVIRAQHIQIDPVSRSWAYVGTTQGLFVSKNNGAAWKRLTSPKISINAVEVDPVDSRKILIGADGLGVLRSDDGGRSWKESNQGFVSRRITKILSIPDDSGGFRLAVSSDGGRAGLSFLSSSGREWLPPAGAALPSEEILSYLRLPGNGRLIGTVQGLYSLQEARLEKLDGPTGKLSIFALALDLHGNWIFAGTNDGIYRSKLEPIEFKKPSGYRMIPRVSSLLVSHASPTVVHATTHLGLLRSRDNGATWDILAAGLPIHDGVQSLAVDPSDPSHMFAGTPAGLYESRDAGASWIRSKEGRLGVAIPSVIFLDSSGNRVLAADNTWGGVFYSGDGGGSWQKISRPEFASPIQFLMQDSANPSSVYLGTRTEGVYRLQLP
jgi:photosystem II stability/assembly factor-like uncharacterized protein